MRTTSVKSYAKLNLTLRITGVEQGYHMLDSIVTTVDLFDTIRLTKRRDEQITIVMHGMDSELIPYEKNNAVKAAQLYMDTYGCAGVDITIYKDIPMGAGMGGSSADISGVLRGMQNLYGLATEQELKALADRLGSDTGYLLTGGYARMQGRGDLVTPINSSAELNFLVLIPHSPVSTAECYRGYDDMPQSGDTRICDYVQRALEMGDTASLKGAFVNDLFPPACQINTEVQQAYEELKNFSPDSVCMSGSGSAVFALFESMELCRWAQSRYYGKFETILCKSTPIRRSLWQKKD